MREKYLIPMSSGMRSISDDDICANCHWCKDANGHMSRCMADWPGLQTEDGYVVQCAQFLKKEPEKTTSMSQADIEALADLVANGAVAAIQDKLGQKHGDFAGVYFSGDKWNVLTAIFAGYIRAEIEHMEA